MAPSLLTATTLAHLSRAAELYATLHPTLSAHLLSRALDLQYTDAPASTTPPSPPDTVCPHCAAPKLPGTTGTLRTARHELVWSCATCGTESTTPVPRPRARAGRVKKRPGAPPGVLETKDGADAGKHGKEEEAKGKAVKKKRAKQKGGKLAAMLAREKAGGGGAGGAGAGFGLDLADLMKLG